MMDDTYAQDASRAPVRHFDSVSRPADGWQLGNAFPARLVRGDFTLGQEDLAIARLEPVYETLERTGG